MVLLLVEFLSTFLLILSLLLLSAILVKHFKGMQLPAHWVYYLGAFSLLAISSVYTKLSQGDFVAIDTGIRLVANISILLGSYEIFRRYESRVSEKLAAGRKKRRRAKTR